MSTSASSNSEASDDHHAVTGSQNRMPHRRFLAKFFNLSTRIPVFSQTTFDRAKLQRLAALYDAECKTKKPSIPKFMNRAAVLQMYDQPAWPAKKERISQDMVATLKKEQLIPDCILQHNGKKRTLAELRYLPEVLKIFDERVKKRKTAVPTNEAKISEHRIQQDTTHYSQSLFHVDYMDQSVPQTGMGAAQPPLGRSKPAPSGDPPTHTLRCGLALPRPAPPPRVANAKFPPEILTNVQLQQSFNTISRFPSWGQADTNPRTAGW